MSQVADSQLIITTFIDGIRPSFNFVVGITAFNACLLTLLVIMFVFSTRESRRRPVFRLNVMSILIATVLGILNGITSGRAILDPFHSTPESIYVATIFFATFSPLFYDSILLTRLLMLYPVEVTPVLQLFRIFGFPVCIKCCRLVVLSLYLHQFIQSTKSLLSLEQHAEATWFRNPYITAEWTMQILDNMYCVAFFLYKLHSRTSRIQQTNTVTERIRRIFFIAIANFVFPLIFNIAQLICITTNRSFALGTMFLLTNGYVTVIGVLCATIWASGSEWIRIKRNTPAESSQPSNQGRTERFVPFQVEVGSPDSYPKQPM
ncbi:hypothetical protein J3A83DRAFT_1975525 [Scleroderma citrinum]